MSAVLRSTGPGKRALVALAMGAIIAPFTLTGIANAAVRPITTNACPEDEVTGPEVDFDDIAGLDAEAQLAINCIADYGVTQGVDEDSFEPGGSVSRVQMALFLARLISLGGNEGLDDSPAGFRDISRLSEDAQTAINILANLEVTTGVTATEYRPADRVTRAQMASFLVRTQAALGVPFERAADDHFDDDDGFAPHEANINIIAENGLAQGVGDRQFGPMRPTTRAQMARFLARQLDLAVEEGIIPLPEEFQDNPTDPTDPTDPTAPTATLTTEGDIMAGATIAGLFADLPENVTAITATGAGLENVTVEVDETGAFELVLPEDLEAGPQQVTFTITLDDGTEVTATLQFEVTAEVQVSTTARPDLLSASVVSTVAPGQATPTSPAGTTVRYTFDENVTVVGEVTVGNPATAFTARLSDGTALTNGAFAASTATTVDVLFSGVTTTTGAGSAEDITLATADFNAVTDSTGLANPEYDAPMGAMAGGPITLPAGVTDAPDLVGVGGFRQGADVGETAVDFTFDEAAFVTGGGQFSLVLTDGSVVPATEVPAVGSTTAGGGTVAGGNGTTTITVIVPSPASTQTPAPPLAASAVARAVVASGTVADAQQIANAPNPEVVEGEANVRQAAQGTGGDTANPDLVSLQLQPSTTGGADRVLFTFDEAVDPTTINVGQFRLYTRDGQELTVAAPQSNPANRAQVLVDVTASTGVAGVVGGSVDAGAVATVAVAATATTPEQPARPNQVDEEGVANTATEAGRTPGLTALPDLTAVAINQAAADQFGNPGQFQATYTFDADVATPTVGEFFLYLGDGTRLRGTTLSMATATEETDNTVTVTGYQVLLVSGAARADDPATTTVNEAVASQAEIQAAVLGTVDAGAVTAETGGAANPIGAERTTGGNGTMQ
jgi:hypothetical protein